MRNPYTNAATKRFVILMRHYIEQQKLKGGKIKSDKAFAESIGHKAQNFNKITRQGQDVNLIILEACGRKYNFNANWVLFNEGEMYRSKDVNSKVDTLESRIKKIEKLLKK